jgi:hypothetical protein
MMWSHHITYFIYMFPIWPHAISTFDIRGNCFPAINCGISACTRPDISKNITDCRIRQLTTAFPTSSVWYGAPRTCGMWRCVSRPFGVTCARATTCHISRSHSSIGTRICTKFITLPAIHVNLTTSFYDQIPTWSGHISPSNSRLRWRLSFLGSI